jgi:cell division protein FtsL
MNNYRTTNKRRVRAKTNVFLSQQHVFWTLITLIIFFVFFYAYFINATVLNTAKLSKIEEKIVDTRSEISQLEFNLIEENKSFTKQYAVNLGLVEVENTVFVSRNSKNLSFND